MSEAVFASTTEELFKLHDGDSDGLINFLEFKRLYVKVHPLTPTRKANDNQWRALFNVYDMDKDGRLNWNESWRYFKFRERFNN
jgi:Ca2+-binding EF-hand superfamily protein